MTQTHINEPAPDALREAAQLALDAIRGSKVGVDWGLLDAAEKLSAALAQPAPEPAGEAVTFDERRDRFAAAALTGLLARGLDDDRAVERALAIGAAMVGRSTDGRA